MTKFSIIIPMYNVEKYIKKCINSCLNQTYKNYEVIIVDDQSSDNSLNIAKSMCKDVSFVKILKQKNSGVSVARNKGLLKSNGDYVLFVDGDDWLEYDALAKLNDCILTNSSSDIIITGFYTNKGDKEINDHFFEEKNIVFSNNDNLEIIKNCICKTNISNEKASTNVGVPWAKAYKRKFLLNNECKFVPGLKRMQDMIFNLKAFLLAKNVICVDYKTYHYRINEGSVTKKFSSDFDITVYNILNELSSFIKINNLNDELKDYYEAKAIKLYLEMIRIQYSPDGLPIGNKEKIKMLKKKLNDPIFSNHINLHHQYLLSRNERILNVLLNINLVSIVYYMYRIKFLLKK